MKIIKMSVKTFSPMEVGSSINLLSYLEYTPPERSQGNFCGNCWAWAATGILEIALSASSGEPLSNEINGHAVLVVGYNDDDPNNFYWYGQS